MSTQLDNGPALAAALLVLSCSAVALAEPQGGPEQLAPIELEPLNDVLAGPARVVDLSTQILSIVETDAAIPALEVQLQLGGEVRTLVLTPFSMRAPDCRFYVQDATGLRAIEPPPITTYRGRVLEDQQAIVHGSWHDGRFHATIFDGNGERWAVEPVSSLLGGLPPDWHVVYNTDAVLPDPGQCGVTPEMMAAGGAAEDGAQGGDVELGGPGVGQTQIGFDADFEFYMANGSSVAATIADIEWIMNNVGTIYQTQMLGDDPICYRLTGFIVRTIAADPYSSTDEDVLLCQFMNWWNDNVPDNDSGIPRDVAHLFTGKDVDDNTIGYAFVGSICDEEISNCNGGKGHYGFSQMIENATNRIGLTAHELGHSWSACHCDESGCTGGAGDPDCGIMNSTISGSLVFGNRSLQAIDNYRDNVSDCLVGCLQAIFVDLDAPLPGCGGVQNGSSICPFDTIAAGYNASHWVGGELRIAPGAYPAPIVFDSVYRSPMIIRRWDTGGSGPVVIGGN